MSERKWVWAVWEILGILTFFSGFVSGNVVTMVIGVVVAFGFASLYLTSYVRSDHIVKRALEVIFMLSAFGVVIYGYTITGNLILGVITIFIATIVFVAFLLSYLLPRIRSESKSCQTQKLRVTSNSGDVPAIPHFFVFQDRRILYNFVKKC